MARAVVKVEGFRTLTDTRHPAPLALDLNEIVTRLASIMLILPPDKP